MTSLEDDEVKRRKGLSFEQAEGLAPLPAQLKFKEVSKELRAVLWQHVHSELENSSMYDSFAGHHMRDPWRLLLKNVHVFRDHLFADDYSTDFDVNVARVRRVFESGSYAQIFGWLQFVMQLLEPKFADRKFADRIDKILKYCKAPYRVIEKTIIPIGSVAEAETIAKAFDDLVRPRMSGAREHLKLAATELTVGNYADSVRESIHAVESVAKIIEPTGDFSKALAKLEATAQIHGGLKAGFAAIYGYTSDEKGIRHSLLDKGAAAVDETDALFMIGACAAFVSYLINKARATGLIK